MDAAYVELSKYNQQDNRSSNADIMKTVAEAVEKMAEKTQTMGAQVGRAAYVHQDLVRKMDPGAYAVFIWINAIRDVIKNKNESKYR